MGAYTVIGDVSSTIVKLLRDNLTPEPILKPELIELSSPADKGDFKLTVYLYSIKENGEFRNPNSMPYNELSIQLFYLITAHSSAELKTRAYDEQYIMGRAMQIMNENSILKGSVLQGTLSERDETVKVMLHSFTTDDMSKVWTFPDVPYKLSVAYEVGPIFIDSQGGSVGRRVMKN